MRTFALVLGLLFISPTAEAEVLYTYSYDLTETFPDVVGDFAFGAPGFITTTRYFPAIYHNDPVGLAFQSVEFRNPFQGVDGSPLIGNPVIDLKLNGFEIDSFAGGSLNQVGTYTSFDFGPHDHAGVTVALAPRGVLYTYSYDLADTFPGVAGDFSFTAPEFLTSSISFEPISHTDPAGTPLEYVEVRNPFQGLDGSVLVQNPVIDSIFSGFEIDAFAGGPLNQFGTYTPFDFGPHFRASLTISGSVPPVPLPATLPLFASGLAGLGWFSKRKRKAAA